MEVETSPAYRGEAAPFKPALRCVRATINQSSSLDSFARSCRRSAPAVKNTAHGPFGKLARPARFPSFRISITGCSVHPPLPSSVTDGTCLRVGLEAYAWHSEVWRRKPADARMRQQGSGLASARCFVRLALREIGGVCPTPSWIQNGSRSVAIPAGQPTAF